MLVVDSALDNTLLSRYMLHYFCITCVKFYQMKIYKK
jgi:hypothetical protein